MALKMVYRAGSEPNPGVDNLPVEHKVIEKADLDAALADGWYVSPADIPAAAPLSALDENAASLIAAIPEMTRDELAGMLGAEKDGKARKGLIAALEKALAAIDAEKVAAT